LPRQRFFSLISPPLFQRCLHAAALAADAGALRRAMRGCLRLILMLMRRADTEMPTLAATPLYC